MPQAFRWNGVRDGVRPTASHGPLAVLAFGVLFCRGRHLNYPADARFAALQRQQHANQKLEIAYIGYTAIIGEEASPGVATLALLWLVRRDLEPATEGEGQIGKMCPEQKKRWISPIPMNRARAAAF
jgi:hypothetical protein